MSRKTTLNGPEIRLWHLAAASVLAACGNGAATAAAPPAAQADPGPQPSVGTPEPESADFTDLSPEELGGQSGVEGDGCFDPNLRTLDVTLDERIETIGFSAADVLAYAGGVRSANVRWATVDPPGMAAGVSGTMQVELTAAGPARATVSGCGSYIELPVRFHVRSDSGVLDLEGTSTLFAMRGRATLQARFPLIGTGDWLAAVQPAMDLGVEPTLELFLSFSPSAGMSGTFYLRGAGLCSLAQWPAESCQLGVDDPEHGARVRELLRHLEQAPVSWDVPELRWADGSTTGLSVTAEPTASTACVDFSVDEHGELRPFASIQAPVRLHVVTADGRIDAVLPGRVGGLVGADGRWSRLSFITNEEVSGAPGGFGRFDFAALGAGDRPVVYLSGERTKGYLTIQSLAPISSALRDLINAGCRVAPAVNNGRAQAGHISDMTSASWLL